MSRRPIVIVGTGGSGRETLVLLRDLEEDTPGVWDFRGFLGITSPDPDLLRRLDAPFLGSPLDISERYPGSRDWTFVVGIGSGADRRHMDEALTAQGLSRTTLVHPTARIGIDVEIGPGSVICAQSVITTNVHLGQGCQVNIGCVIAHDARIGEFVTFAQCVNVAGNVTIGDGATVYTRAVLNPGVHVGTNAVVGAGAVVIRDVGPETTVAGVPARSLT